MNSNSHIHRKDAHETSVPMNNMKTEEIFRENAGLYFIRKNKNAFSRIFSPHDDLVWFNIIKPRMI